MTTSSKEPTARQVQAARVRLKADKRLHRESPEWIQSLAKKSEKK